MLAVLCLLAAVPARAQLEGMQLEDEVDDALKGWREEVRLTSYSASVPDVGRLHLSDFHCGQLRLQRHSPLDLPPDSRPGSTLVFHANTSALLIEYKDLRLEVGDIMERYMVVGTMETIVFRVTVHTSDCSVQVQQESVANTALKVRPKAEGARLLGLAEVLAEWLEPVFWKQLSVELERAVADGLKSFIGSRHKLCDHQALSTSR